MKRLMRATTLALILNTIFFSTRAQAALLTIDQYLSQVKTQNPGFTGSALASAGGLERSREGALLVTPSVFADAQLSADSKLPTFPGFTYDRYDYDTYDVGLSQQTTFGLTAKLYYSFDYNHYKNVSFGTPGTSDLTFFEARPAIELSQDLWSNGFGRGTRAQQEFLEAQALSSSFASSFSAKTILSDAQTSYWRLSIARQIVRIQQDAEDRAQKIYDWNVRRAKLHLGDEADALQALAALKQRKLEVQSALDDLRTSSRAFNVQRNVDSDDVPEEITGATYEIAQQLKIPKKAAMREDVKAAQQNARAQEANATYSIEKDRPVLQLYASYALNGRDNNMAPAMNDSFSSGRPTEAAGVRFSAPLDLGLLSNTHNGWKKEREAAEQLFQKKVFDEQQGWIDLNERFGEAKRRLDYAREIESVQHDKLTYEKDRLRKGRTTTYQVLLFEQDYILAQANRVRLEADIFSYFAQLQLYGEGL